MISLKPLSIVASACFLPLFHFLMKYLLEQFSHRTPQFQFEPGDARLSLSTPLPSFVHAHCYCWEGGFVVGACCCAWVWCGGWLWPFRVRWCGQLWVVMACWQGIIVSSCCHSPWCRVMTNNEFDSLFSQCCNVKHSSWMGSCPLGSLPKMYFSKT
jgi:hypothetical protein